MDGAAIAKIHTFNVFRPFFHCEIEKSDLENAIAYFQLHSCIAHKKLKEQYARVEGVDMTHKMKKKHMNKIDDIYIEFATATFLTCKNTKTKDCLYIRERQTEGQFFNLFKMLVEIVQIENGPRYYPYIGIYIDKAKKYITSMKGDLC
jgi:hypothetical protein